MRETALIIYMRGGTGRGPKNEGGQALIDLRQGDCLEVMQTIPDNTIDLTVTSPPYDNLRTYNGNIGQWSFEKFQGIARQLYRVTKQGGVVVWVVADATINGSETGTSFRQALWFMECGFNLHDTMIYEKAGTGACGSNLAYWQSYDFMFVLSKGKTRTVNRIADHKNISEGATCTKGRVSADGRDKEIRRRVVPARSVRGNVWRFVVGHDNRDDRIKHPARFPEQLANDHIISWSNPSDIVLDPFMGSGTTGKMAIQNGRNFIGIELDPDYFKIAERRIAEAGRQITLEGVLRGLE